MTIFMVGDKEKIIDCVGWFKLIYLLLACSWRGSGGVQTIEYWAMVRDVLYET